MLVYLVSRFEICMSSNARAMSQESPVSSKVIHIKVFRKRSERAVVKYSYLDPTQGVQRPVNRG